MNYETLQLIMRNKDRFLLPFNSADGTTTDGSTDAVITRDPNNYLAPRADGNGLVGFILLASAVASLIASIIIIIPYVKSKLQ
jgi:hypothetical protein